MSIPPGESHDASEYRLDSPTDTHNAAELTLLDAVVLLAKHKWLILGCVLLVTSVAAVYSLLIPNKYTASAKILPPQQGQSNGGASALLGQLGVMTGIPAGALPIKNPSDLYVGMLKSRTVADKLIERFQLNSRYGQAYQSWTRRLLELKSTILTGKDGIISIDIEDEDAQLAAALANGYVEELLKLTQVLAVTEASQRRLFFEQQLGQARENLVKAEATARDALQQGGLVKVDEQGRAMVEMTARLRAQAAVKEVQLGAMRTFASENNPDLRVVQQELESIKRELARLEGTGLGHQLSNSATGKGLENLRLLRDLKYHETLYELLARQFELAKIDEAKDAAVVQVLDHAVAPDFKSKPKRVQIVLGSFLAAIILGILLVFLWEALGRIRRDPNRAAQLQLLKHYLASR